MDKPPGNPWPLAGSLTALAMAVILGGSLFVAASMQPAQIKPVSGFDPYKAADNSFTCVYPKGWSKVSRAGAQGTESSGEFKQGEARIEVLSSLSASLMSEGPPMPVGGMEEIPNVPGSQEVNEVIRNAKRSPAERAHHLFVKQLEKDLGNYTESATHPFQSRAGEGVVAEFTATGGLLGGKLKGYHATLMGTERAINVVCQCPEANWGTLKPAFDKVIASVAPGSG